MDKDQLQKIFTPDQYQVRLFEEKGHVRRQCSNCGNYFWTLDQDKWTCGDTSCEGGYHFIGRKGPNWDFHQTISNLTSFFEKNGHTPIDPYPVIARWRDDLEFTIASIADFQPWVTNGTLPPPANPLTVPQPCLRFGGEFSDVDNVGRTGRHLTSFVMFGQHSFNSETITNGYWMDHCIDLNFRFLTEQLGLKPIEITYVEGIWMGGGNFGPNLESFAFGSEIVNSVFMQYENTSTGYKEMELRVIDVGWGTERTSWFSQGTPTIYEATLGPVLDYILKQSGIKVNKKLVADYSKIAGLIDINEVKDVKSARSSIAETLGLTLEELNKELFEIEAVYAIGDHARTLAFAFGDGAIPSNVGGGYNIRTMIRRLFTLNEALGGNLDLLEIISRTAIYVSQSFPRVKDSVELAGTILDIEKTRHETTLAAGIKHINRLIKSKKALNEDTLFELYSSRGIYPETVAKIALDHDIFVDVPLDFYSKVDAKREEEREEITQAEMEVNFDEIKSLDTKMLYYDTPPKKTANAKILKIIENQYIVLNETIFYPTGGGQAEDLGWISYSRQKLEVKDVKKFGNAIVHTVSNIPENFKEGLKVKLTLDWERREALMRHHTAVHIVGGAAREVLGKHIWQAGADKSPTRGRLDITHWDSISRETLDEIEYVANQVVMDNKKIKKHILERTSAENKFGFTIYQGGVVPGKELRIIEIPGIDVEACGGTHADNTGQIGYIRLLGTERIQDGIVRITLTAGKKAVERAQEEYRLLTESAKAFSVTPNELPVTSKRFFNEWKDQQKMISRLSGDLAEARVPTLLAKAKEIKTASGHSIKLIIERVDAPQGDLIKLGERFSELTEKEGNVVAIILGDHEDRAMIVASRSKGSKLDLIKPVREIGKLLGGGGGGKGDVIAGGGTKTENIDLTKNKTEAIIKEIL